VEYERTPRERALELIRLLLGLDANWQPAPHHYIWAIRLVLGGTVLLALLYLIGEWVWGMLVDYIEPKTATQKKDLANIFVIIAAGVVATLTAIAALGNLYVSRRNLQNARETLAYQRSVDEQRGQGEALQAYLQQIGTLMLEYKLVVTRPEHPVRVLAQAQTLSVLERLNASHKRDLIDFLHKAGLIMRDTEVLSLAGADLRTADLHEAKLPMANFRQADLTGADLTKADLTWAILAGANLRGADLTEANLTGATIGVANLSKANLRGAYRVTDGKTTPTEKTLIANRVLEARVQSLQGATMPDGQKYEEWLKVKEDRGDDGENGGPL
jgi:uncharacterized protein YjbI with pentapeptide repeats